MAHSNTTTPARFPWADQDDEIGCNLAFAHLVQNLPRVLADQNGRVHAETLMTAAGAIAGFAAHVSLVSDPAAMAAATKAGTLSNVTLVDGRELLFGDALNAMLLAGEDRFAPARVWNTLAGTAISRGASESDLPNLDEMFGYVSRMLGDEREGWPSTAADHQPQLSAREAIRAAGPFAVQCLNGKIDRIATEQGFAAKETSWVAVTAQAAAALLNQAAGVLRPEIAARLAMEAAIYSSKLKPVLPGS